MMVVPTGNRARLERRDRLGIDADDDGRCVMRSVALAFRFAPWSCAGLGAALHSAAMFGSTRYGASVAAGQFAKSISELIPGIGTGGRQQALCAGPGAVERDTGIKSRLRGG